MRNGLALAIAVALLVGMPSLAPAQGTTSRMLGTVVDTTGGVLPGATVTLTNQGTRISFTTVTTAAGTYAFEAVPAGLYEVKSRTRRVQDLPGGRRPGQHRPAGHGERAARAWLHLARRWRRGRLANRPDNHVGQPGHRAAAEGHRVAPDRRHPRP